MWTIKEDFYDRILINDLLLRLAGGTQCDSNCCCRVKKSALANYRSQESSYPPCSYIPTLFETSGNDTPSLLSTGFYWGLHAFGNSELTEWNKSEEISFYLFVLLSWQHFHGNWFCFSTLEMFNYYTHILIGLKLCELEIIFKLVKDIRGTSLQLYTWYVCICSFTGSDFWKWFSMHIKQNK